MTETIWQYGVVSSWYHDRACVCDHHCGNCFATLDDNYDKRARYCSDYCKDLMKRERALDRRMSS